MAEVSSEAAVFAGPNDYDLSLDDVVTADAAGDDFDFDLGGEITQEEEQSVLAGHDASASAAPAGQEGGNDEIGYEDDDDDGVPAGASTTENVAEAPENVETEEGQDTNTEDTGYEAVDISAVMHDVGAAISEQDGPVTLDGEDHSDVAHTDIDFGFEMTGDEDVYSQNENAEETPDSMQFRESESQEHAEAFDKDAEDDSGEEEKDEDDGTAGEEMTENYDEVDGEDEEDEEDEEDAHGGIDESEESMQDDDDSQATSLHTGLDQLHNLHPTLASEVSVTWGEETCPLIKPSDSAKPGSYYLDDVEALDYPLSRFLRTVRGSISPWVNENDEIFIRVDDLGLEFGETTTEALLSQVTFSHLLALHSMLTKNDDPTASKGCHLTLRTRPSCLFRLRNLVRGAGSGMGLSHFQSENSSPDDSSIESDDMDDADEEVDASAHGDKSGGSLPSEKADANAETDAVVEDDEGGAAIFDTGISEAAMTGGSIGDVRSPVTIDRGAAEMPRVDATGEEAIATDEDADFIGYVNEEEAAEGGALLGEASTEEPGVQEAQDAELAENRYSTSIDGDGQGLGENDFSGNTEVSSHRDELDLLGAIDGMDTAGQNQDDNGTNQLAPDNGGDPDSHEHQDDYDHDFLDLGGDLIEAANSDDTQKSPNSETVRDHPDASLDTSATATLDHDEIDYEDSHVETVFPPTKEPTHVTPEVFTVPADGEASLPAVASEMATEAELDEIDWDDDDKNIPSGQEEPPSASKSGKRPREGADYGLLEDVPESKRHRTGNSPT